MKRTRNEVLSRLIRISHKFWDVGLTDEETRERKRLFASLKGVSKPKKKPRYVIELDALDLRYIDSIQISEVKR